MIKSINTQKAHFNQAKNTSQLIHLFVLFLVIAFPLAFAKGLSGNPDDYYYIDAAISWLKNTFYIGQDIRQLRHPHILSITFSLHLFGISNTSIIISTFVYYCMLLIMVYWTIRCMSDWRTALWVVYCLAFVPIIAAYSTLILPFMSELFFSVAAIILYLKERDQEQQNKIKIIFVGVLCGLAFEVRETSGGALIVLLGLLFIFSPGMNRPSYFLIMAGFLSVWICEISYYIINTGSPFHRIHVSMASMERALKEDVHLTNHILQSYSPIFNFELAKSWMPSGLINLHWSINPWINLFFEEDYGLLFYFVIPASWTMLKSESNVLIRRFCKYAFSLGIIWFVLSYYVVSLMQQPRYVAGLPFAGALVVGIWFSQLSKKSRFWSIGLALLYALSSVICLSSKPDELYKERQLAEILSVDPEPIHVMPSVVNRGHVVLKPFVDKQQLRITQPNVGDLVFGQPTLWIKHYPALSNLSWRPAGAIVQHPLLIMQLLELIKMRDMLPSFIVQQLTIKPQVHPISRLLQQDGPSGRNNLNGSHGGSQDNTIEGLTGS